MEPMDFVLIAVLLLLGFFVYKQSKSNGAQDQVNDLSKDLAEMRGVMKSFADNVGGLRDRVDKGLQENMKMLERSQKSIGERIDNSSRAYAAVKSELSRLEEASKRIFDVGKDIASLQDTLKAPKLRGVLGELYLEELLKDRFAKDQYSMQYRFKSGQAVDAVIHLRDGKMVPIDSKFSLENFQKVLQAENEEDRKRVKKTFSSDIKKRIDEISSKYILPDEGTLNFALMYIPAENVYYEVIVKDDISSHPLMEYALEKSVFPVSPNTFAIYLTTILSGLRGLEIEQRAQEIMTYLASLKIDFDKFTEEYGLVGTHLSRAQGSYTKSDKRLSNLSTRLSSLNSGQSKEFLEA